MLEYNRILKFLFNLQIFGIKVGLKNTLTLLDSLGNPQTKFPCVHIAGTNGKGSTAAMIASILTSAGYRTGLYTSPHLIHFNERIRINGKKITDNEVVHYTKILKSKIEEIDATFFETTTAIAFKYFEDNKIDIAVIETGLGGRLDSTNVVTPLVSIITNIGLEHTEHLGSTLENIASEKGGIIKPSVPCITGETNTAVLKVIRTISASKNSPLISAPGSSKADIKHSSLAGSLVTLKTNQNTYENIFLPLAGEHQIINLKTAVLAVEVIQAQDGVFKITGQNIKSGLSSIQKNTGFYGRISILQNNPLIIADVAHNPPGINALIPNLRKLIIGNVIAVFGVMKDKDYQSMIKSLCTIANFAIAVKPNFNRALQSRIILKEMQSLGLKSVDGGSVAKGIQIALQEAKNKNIILITGSHYLVGEALKILKISV